MLICRSDKGVTDLFTSEHLDALDDIFLLNDAQKLYLEPVGEFVGSIITTFSWAYSEGFSAICYCGFELEDFYLDAVEKICRHFNVFYLIMLNPDGCYHLELCDPCFELNLNYIGRNKDGSR